MSTNWKPADRAMCLADSVPRGDYSCPQGLPKKGIVYLVGAVRSYDHWPKGQVGLSFVCNEAFCNVTGNPVGFDSRFFRKIVPLCDRADVANSDTHNQ